MKTTKQSINASLHALVQLMIDEMAKGTGEWVKSWSAPQGRPCNFLTKKAYRGLNFLYLSLVADKKGYLAPFWLTFNQVKELGGKVKKGERSTEIFFYQIVEKSESESEVKEEDSLDDEESKKRFPVLRRYNLFNIEQTEGIEYEIPGVSINSNERYEKAEDFIQRTQAVIRHGGGRAFYHMVEDFIQMPPLQLFSDSDNYYATLFHELIHWSAHPSRLHRATHKTWGDEIYAFEELIAELGALFVSSHLGINIEKNRHPEYLQSWIKSLKENPQVLWRAASKAQRAFDYLLQIVEERKDESLEERVAS